MDVFDLSRVERALVFGAHPDDEIVGPGGTIHRLSSEGVEVAVVTFTSGGTAASSEAEMAAMTTQRKAEMVEADRILGVAHREALGVLTQQVYGAAYGDNTLHRVLIRIVRQYRPDVLFSHSPDNHRDHTAIHAATREALFQASEHITLDLGDPWAVEPVMYYAAELELPVVNVVIGISDADLAAKIEAMDRQASQTRDGYLARWRQMMHARAELWGAKAYGAGRHAEAFHLNPALPIRT